MRIHLKNGSDDEAVRWNLYDAWISGWNAAPMSASDNEIAIETMTIVYDRLEWV